jgi:hypothetical protein
VYVSPPDKLSDADALEALLEHYQCLDPQDPVHGCRAYLEEEAALYLTFIPSLEKQHDFVGKLEDMIKPIAEWTGAPVKFGAAEVLAQLKSYDAEAKALIPLMATGAVNMREDANKIAAEIDKIHSAMSGHEDHLKWLKSVVASAGGAQAFLDAFLPKLDDADDDTIVQATKMSDLDGLYRDLGCGASNAPAVVVRRIYEHSEVQKGVSAAQEKAVLEAAAKFSRVSTQLQAQVETTFRSFVVCVSEIAHAAKSKEVQLVKAAAEVAKITVGYADIVVSAASVPLHGIPLIGTALAETLDKAFGWTSFAVNTIGVLAKDLTKATMTLVSYASGTAGQHLEEMEAFDLLEQEVELLEDLIETTLGAVSNAVPHPASTIMKIVKDPAKALLLAPLKAAILKGKAAWQKEQEPEKKRETFAGEVKKSFEEALKPSAATETLASALKTYSDSQHPDFSASDLGSGVASIASGIVSFLIETLVPPLLAKVIPACLTPGGLSGLQASEILEDCSALPRKMAEAEPETYRLIGEMLGVRTSPAQQPPVTTLEYSSDLQDSIDESNGRAIFPQEAPTEPVDGQYLLRRAATGKADPSHNPDFVLLVGFPTIESCHNLAVRNFVGGVNSGTEVRAGHEYVVEEGGVELRWSETKQAQELTFHGLSDGKSQDEVQAYLATLGMKQANVTFA